MITKNEIISSMKLCSQKSCENCCYKKFGNGTCESVLLADCISFIEKQDSRIESLIKENANLYKEMYYRL